MASLIEYRVVSQKYNIPRSTLFNKLTGKYDMDKEKPGPVAALTAREERHLVDYLKGMSAIGHGLNRIQLKEEVKHLLDGGRDAHKRFKNNNLPSTGWVIKFLRRHKAEITSRTPQHLDIQRAFVTENNLRTWFSDFKSFLMEEHGIIAEEFLSEANANRIFNSDKSGFPLAGTHSHKLKVITPKGEKNVCQVGPDKKEQITVLATVSADGYFCKPMVLYTGAQERFTYNGINTKDYCLGKSKSGWIMTDTFFEYVANHFYPEVVSKGIKFPIILFFDGHHSHINYLLAAFCKAKQIIAYCFPPHASHVIQPLDVSVFGPLKHYYNSSLQERAKTQRISMSKGMFIEVFDVAWKRVKEANVVRQGFRKCGLLPFDPNALDYGRLVGGRPQLLHPLKQNTLMEKDAYTRTINAVEDLLLSDQQKEEFKNLCETDGELEQQENVVSINKIFEFYKTIVKWRKNLENVVPPPLENSTPLLQENSPPVHQENSPPLSQENAPLNQENFPPYPRVDYLPSPPSAKICDYSLLLLEDCHFSPPEKFIDHAPSHINLDPTSPEPTSSTAELTTIQFDNYDQAGSPWKKMLKIPDKYVSRKTIPKKSDVPFCVSADKNLLFYKKKQEEKYRMEKEKREKKIAREEKKKLPPKPMVARKLNVKTGKRQRKVLHEEESEDDCIFSDGTLEIEVEGRYSNGCQVCHSDEGHAYQWVGCDQCHDWFHKECTDIDFENMDDIEFTDFNWMCNKCEKKQC